MRSTSRLALRLSGTYPVHGYAAIIPNEGQVWKRRVWRGVRDTGCRERE